MLNVHILAQVSGVWGNLEYFFFSSIQKLNVRIPAQVQTESSTAESPVPMVFHRPSTFICRAGNNMPAEFELMANIVPRSFLRCDALAANLVPRAFSRSQARVKALGTRLPTCHLNRKACWDHGSRIRNLFWWYYHDSLQSRFTEEIFHYDSQCVASSYVSVGSDHRFK